MRVAFFEDSGAANFHPLALARPVFELVCGRYSLRERIVRHCAATEWGVFVRENLAETYREAHPEAHVNDFVWLSRSPTLVINGRWLPSAVIVSLMSVGLYLLFDKAMDVPLPLGLLDVLEN